MNGILEDWRYRQLQEDEANLERRRVAIEYRAQTIDPDELAEKALKIFEVLEHYSERPGGEQARKLLDELVGE